MARGDGGAATGAPLAELHDVHAAPAGRLLGDLGGALVGRGEQAGRPGEAPMVDTAVRTGQSGYVCA